MAGSEEKDELAETQDQDEDGISKLLVHEETGKPWKIYVYQFQNKGAVESRIKEMGGKVFRRSAANAQYAIVERNATTIKTIWKEVTAMNPDIVILDKSFIFQTYEKKELQDVDMHAVTQPKGVIRSTTRNLYTPFEDHKLVKYIYRYCERGSQAQAVVYRLLSETYPQHTEQSWKERRKHVQKASFDAQVLAYGKKVRKREEKRREPYSDSEEEEEKEGKYTALEREAPQKRKSRQEEGSDADEAERRPAKKKSNGEGKGKEKAREPESSTAKAKEKRSSKNAVDDAPRTQPKASTCKLASRPPSVPSTKDKHRPEEEDELVRSSASPELPPPLSSSNARRKAKSPIPASKSTPKEPLRPPSSQHRQASPPPASAPAKRPRQSEPAPSRAHQPSSPGEAAPQSSYHNAFQGNSIHVHPVAREVGWAPPAAKRPRASAPGYLPSRVPAQPAQSIQTDDAAETSATQSEEANDDDSDPAIQFMKAQGIYEQFVQQQKAAAAAAAAAAPASTSAPPKSSTSTDTRKPASKSQPQAGQAKDAKKKGKAPRKGGYVDTASSESEEEDGQVRTWRKGETIPAKSNTSVKSQINGTSAHARLDDGDDLMEGTSGVKRSAGRRTQAEVPAEEEESSEEEQETQVIRDALFRDGSMSSAEGEQGEETADGRDKRRQSVVRFSAEKPVAAPQNGHAEDETDEEVEEESVNEQDEEMLDETPSPQVGRKSVNGTAVKLNQVNGSKAQRQSAPPDEVDSDTAPNGHREEEEEDSDSDDEDSLVGLTSRPLPTTLTSDDWDPSAVDAIISPALFDDLVFWFSGDRDLALSFARSLAGEADDGEDIEADGRTKWKLKAQIWMPQEDEAVMAGESHENILRHSKEEVKERRRFLQDIEDWDRVRFPFDAGRD